MISPCYCWTRPSHSVSWKNPSACPQSPASPGGTNAGWQDGGRPKLVSNGSASLGSALGKSHITGVWGWASKPKGEGRGWKARGLRKEGGEELALEQIPEHEEHTEAWSQPLLSAKETSPKALSWDARCGPSLGVVLSRHHMAVSFVSLTINPPVGQGLSALLSHISVIHALMFPTWFLQAFKTPALA